VASDTASADERLAKVCGRARRLADAHEFEAVLELLDEFLPDADAGQAELRAQMLVLRGKARQILGDWPSAEEDLRTVLGLATRLSDRSSLVDALIIMAELQKDRGDLQESQDTYANAARVAEAIDDRLGAAEASLALAAICSKMGNAAECETHLEAARTTAEAHRGQPRAMRILAAVTIQRAVEAMRKGAQDETLSRCREALALMQDDPLSLEAAEAHRFIGVVASMRLQHKEALESHTRTLDVFKKTGYRFGQAKIYNSIGQTLLAMSRSDEALHFMAKAERICSELGAMAEAATLYGKRGQVYLQMEDFPRAIEWFQKDLQISRARASRRALAYIHRNLGMAIGQSGEVSEAIGHFKESLQLFQALSDELNAGKIYMDLCELYVRQKAFDRARAMAQWATNILSKLKQPFEMAYMDALMGSILRGEKNYPEAEKHFRNAVEFFNFREPTARLVDTLYGYAKLLVDMGRKDRAMERLKEALEIARDLGLKQQSARCFGALEALDEIYLLRTFVETPS